MQFFRGRLAAVAVAAAIATVAACGGDASDPAETPQPTPETAADSEAPETTETQIEDAPALLNAPESSRQAPELRNVNGWINSEPFSLKDQRGNVVLIDFWTYTCVNCIRTLPYLRAWHEKYADHGLVVLGVHTPEFEFEEVRENVIKATEEFNLRYAVVQDNKYGTWNAFENRFWPAKYLIDKEGLIRYEHFGEGAYDETEAAIRELLIEAGNDLSGIIADTSPAPAYDADATRAAGNTGLTRELYAGFQRNYNALASGTVPPYILFSQFYEEPGVELMYDDPGDYQNHFLYLQGLWRNELESIVHARGTSSYEDYIGIKFYATSVNAVMAPGMSESFQVRVTLDGAPVVPDDAGADVMYDDEGNSFVSVDSPRMYNLVNLSMFGGHELLLSSNSSDFELFAYTFGAYEDGEPVELGGS